MCCVLLCRFKMFSRQRTGIKAHLRACKPAEPRAAQISMESLTPGLTEVAICGNIFTKEGNNNAPIPHSTLGSVAADLSFGAVTAGPIEAAGGSASPLTSSCTYQVEAECSK